MLRLTDLLRVPVVAGGTELGRVADLAVALRGSHPPLEAVQVRIGRRTTSTYSLSSDARIGPGRIELGDVPAEAPPRERLMLNAHVLDAQVVDLAGRRVVRVSDVVLAESAPEPRLVGIEFGPAPLLRRLGMRRLAARAGSETVDWAAVHLASAPGHALQLKMPRAAIHSLDPAELGELISHLPGPRAAEAIAATGSPAHTEPQYGVPRHRRRGRRFGRVMRARRRAPS